jgi:hypothetical protein
MKTIDWLVSLDKKSIHSHLEKGPLLVTFTKKDGTLRAMKCTLAEWLVPQVETKNPAPRVIAENDNLVKVYDLEKQGWRSFNIDSIVSIYLTNE